jgi:hypothetical protein
VRSVRRHKSSLPIPVGAMLTAASPPFGEVMANKLSDARIRLNCAKKIAHLRHFQSGGGQQFKSLLLHTLVSKFSDITENQSKSARVRAICDEVWTRRATAAGLIGEILQNLSAVDSSGSTDVRWEFARSDRNLARPC